MTEKGAGISAPAYLLTDCSIGPEDVCALSDQDGGFSVSHLPPDDAAWIELLVDGLTFDLTGLSADLLVQSVPAHLFDIELNPQQRLAKIELSPGPHISAARNVPGVVAAHLKLLAKLAGLSGVSAVGWAPANSLMSPTYFSKVVTNWLNGGTFPALGIVALNQVDNESIESEGLSYFTGQEILVPIPNGNAQAAAKLAVRAIDYLVEREPIDSEHTIEAPDGGHMLLSLDREINLVRVLT